MGQRKPYNPNTKYGRKKLREQARINYENGTPEYRQSVDEIGCWVWAVIIAIMLIIFILITVISGPEAALKWIK